MQQHFTPDLTLVLRHLATLLPTVIGRGCQCMRTAGFNCLFRTHNAFWVCIGAYSSSAEQQRSTIPLPSFFLPSQRRLPRIATEDTGTPCPVLPDAPTLYLAEAASPRWQHVLHRLAGLGRCFSNVRWLPYLYSQHNPFFTLHSSCTPLLLHCFFLLCSCCTHLLGFFTPPPPPTTHDDSPCTPWRDLFDLSWCCCFFFVFFFG